MKSKLSFWLALAALLVPYKATLAEQTHLHITTGFTPPVSDYYALVLAEADRRMEDISISFEVLTAERSVDLANRGIVDGECCRIPAVLAQPYPDLIPTHQSFFTVRFVAFSKRKDLKLQSWEDLKPLSVATVTGWKLAVNKAREVNPAQFFELPSMEQAFRMLEMDRVDVVVTGYLSGLKTLSDLNISGVQAHLDPPMAELPLFLMLNRQHADRVDDFDHTLKEMIEDGTTRQIYANVLKRLNGNGHH